MTSYRIVRIKHIPYKNAIESIYLKRPGLASQPFKVQQNIFFQEKACHTNSFAIAMNDLGNEAHEIIYDCQIMQQTWAKEKGVKYDEKHWQADIIIAQLRYLKPDVVFIQDPGTIPRDMINSLKEIVPSLRVTVIQKGFPGGNLDFYNADIFFVSSPILYKRCSALRPYLLYHAFDDEIIKQLQETVNGEDENRMAFTFMGSTRVPELRYWMLRKLLQATSIEIWSEEDKSGLLGYKRIPLKDKTKKMMGSFLRRSLITFYGESLPTFLKSQYLPIKLKNIVMEIENPFLYKTKNLDGLKKGRPTKKTLRDLYPERCHESLFGIDYYRVLMHSDIVFNFHAEAANNTVDNMKMFEATGVGACLLTDTGSNMKDLFEENKEVVTYSSVDDAIEKVKFLTNNEGERKKIAKAGQSRTLRDHTVRQRCKIMDEIIKKKL